MQYAERIAPECRGRLRANGEGKYGYRAIVPVSYAIPNDVSGNSSICMSFCVGDGSRYCRVQQSLLSPAISTTVCQLSVLVSLGRHSVQYGSPSGYNAVMSLW